ncbi:cytochrome ubiquinol oxidase subunit I [Sandaracinobacteroides saxicola]|uniref:Cytochrome ubiquinol oxidase subunit I n=1 Tax=Sandaracinobacteroides saxicola TaxID=2759707 RepID=A0A7G5IKX6_9SPHN|nr:cytochrome ubiquinol oxidase subunit I [Sandaracinobacteroides saxicola]QMW24018.1 cytochrome ubiquinol oxidase subunit I [Sandaracinobacteroides saxicola]
MEWDALILARIQFAWTVAFHIIFPSFTIGLASYLAVLEGSWLVTKNPAFRNLYLFWLKIFAIAFGMGVVSGVVMSYQFGTNWSGFADKGGSVIGPLLGYEVLTAFFLEASFLGIMLFGWKRVGPTLHFVATCAVAVGTLFSAFWIIAANSWMQTPVGFAWDGPRMVATNYWAVIFNPSMPVRLAHMVLAAYLTTGLFVLATAAWLKLRGRINAETRIMQRMAIALVAVLAPLQLIAGHESGKVAHAHQPAKVMAMEGWYETARQPAILLGWPDPVRQTTDVWLALPDGIGSWVVTGDADAVLPGLKTVAPADRPPVGIVFWSFRVMVGLGIAMIGLGLLGALLWATGRLDNARAFHWLAVPMGASGFVAVVAGWFAAEVGRQPWVVYGVVRTADAVSPVSVGAVASSLIAFLIVYAIVFAAGVWYIFRLADKGPEVGETAPTPPNEAPGSALAMVTETAPETAGATA